MKDLLADLDQWQQQHEEVALATLVAVRGSAPRRPGAQMIATRSGKMADDGCAGRIRSASTGH
jgi:xanthine dehydrogenase accessory factor